MRTTIDGAGRVVIPKAIRDLLDLGAGAEVEIEARDGRIEIEATPTPMRLTRQNGRLIAVPERPVEPLTAKQVRATLEAVRR